MSKTNDDEIIELLEEARALAYEDHNGPLYDWIDFIINEIKSKKPIITCINKDQVVSKNTLRKRLLQAQNEAEERHKEFDKDFDEPNIFKEIGKKIAYMTVEKWLLEE